MQENQISTKALVVNHALLQPKLDEFFDRLSHPSNLSKTLNRLLFEALLQKQTILPDELENLHALSDFLLACSLLVPVGEA